MKHYKFPNLFWIVGQPDNGKTTISKWFQKLLECEVIHTDQLYHNWISKNYPNQLAAAKHNIRGHYPRMTKEWQREWNEYAYSVIVNYLKRAVMDLVVEGWLMFYMPDDLKKKLDTLCTRMQIHMRHYTAHASDKAIRPKGRDYTTSVKSLCSLMSKSKGISFMRNLVKYQSFEDIRDFQGVSDSCGKLLALNLPEDLSGKTVLDIGCSTGYFSIRAAQRGATVTGIDKRAKQIKVATKLRTAVYRRLDPEFIKADFYATTFGKQFDYILAVNFLATQGTKIKEFFEKCFNLLKPGGKLIIEASMAAVKPTHPNYHSPFIEFRQGDNGGYQYFNEHMLKEWTNKYQLTYRGRSVRMHGERRRRVYHFMKPLESEQEQHATYSHPELVLCAGTTVPREEFADTTLQKVA